jgi:peptidyl-tRNA hydrolase
VRSEPTDELLSITLIINGPLGMSAGKIAAQAFQACQRLYRAYLAGEGTPAERRRFERWAANGTRTITRIAETAQIFERACRELPGRTMIDEGVTEVAPGSATIHATWPHDRRPAPRMCQHKRAPLLAGPPICDRRG